MELVFSMKADSATLHGSSLSCMFLLEKLYICNLPLRVNSLWMQKWRQTPRFLSYVTPESKQCRAGPPGQKCCLFFNYCTLFSCFFPSRSIIKLTVFPFSWPRSSWAQLLNLCRTSPNYNLSPPFSYPSFDFIF